MLELFTTPAETTQVFVCAQDAAPPTGQGGLGLLPLLLMLGIFYFVMIRPQMKDQKKHRELLKGLQKGQRVVTTSGLHGRVHEVSEATVEVEIANNVRVTLDKVAVKRQQEGD